MSKLLNIAIPTYNRADKLRRGLDVFIEQIRGKYEHAVDIHVVDDASTDDTPALMADYAARHPFVHSRRLPANIGLERNLIECTRGCDGQYLWIFGDDDFLEAPDALDVVMAHLARGEHDLLVLNRTRRSFGTAELIDGNWLRLDPAVDRVFPSLLDFCKMWGVISVIGFISVNIFRRTPFHAVDDAPYYGIFYPQLGMMLEAFARVPCLSIGRPLVCQRTQTEAEKKAALGDKCQETDFMSGYRKRNAAYFGVRLAAFLERLVAVGAMTHADLWDIREHVFEKHPLCVFVHDNVALQGRIGPAIDDADRALATRFFAATGQRFPRDPDRPRAGRPTISVITPSYGQAEFVGQCLASVRDQSVPALEHLVYDPGSTDGSREIIAGFPHATLLAEPDEGQSHAVNKGYGRARGDILGWLNSDDFYFDDQVFARVLERFEQPDRPDIVYGLGVYVDADGGFLRDAYINGDPASLAWKLQHEVGIMQPATFIRAEVVDRVGFLRQDLTYCMDYHYMIRCAKAGCTFAHLPIPLARATYHVNNKTYGQRGNSYEEVCTMLVGEYGFASHVWLRRYAEYLQEGFDGVLRHAANAAPADAAAIEDRYRELLARFNDNAAVRAVLEIRHDQPGYSQALAEMRRQGFWSVPAPVAAAPAPAPAEPKAAAAPAATVPERGRDDHACLDETDIVAELLADRPAGSVMVDVGAHQGGSLAPFLDRGWRIFAFEPDNANRAGLLRRLAEHPRRELVTLSDQAVSDVGGREISFYTSAESTGVSSLKPFLDSHAASQRVGVTTLREALPPLPRVDFLKIDTEGFDLNVLRGLPWDRFTPDVVECEFEDAKTVPLGYTFHDLAGFLVERGYTVFVSEWHPIIRYGIRHDWRRLTRYPSELADPRGWGNLLAVRDPGLEPRLVQAFAAASRPAPKPESPPAPKPAAAPATVEPAAGPTGSDFEAAGRLRRTAPGVFRLLPGTSDGPNRLTAVFPAGGGTAGREYCALLTVAADRPVRLDVSLARYAATPYEGNQETFALAAGQTRRVAVRFTFTADHAKHKLQLDLPDVGANDSLTLTLADVRLTETLTSRRRAVPLAEQTLNRANRLFRDGDYETAMALLAPLHRSVPLSLYGDNILWCARRLGWTGFANADELLGLLD